MNLKRLLCQTSIAEVVFSKELVNLPTTALTDSEWSVPARKTELPELLFLCRMTSPNSFELVPSAQLSSVDETFEILAEGQDKKQSPLKRCVEWRIERRFGEPIVSSTFIVSRTELQELKIPQCLMPETRLARVTLESYISNKWKRIRKTLVPSSFDNDIVDSPLIVINRRNTRTSMTMIPTFCVGDAEDFLVIDQDIDFSRPFGPPTLWRIEKRGEDEVHCATWQCTAEEIRKVYGSAADAIIGSRSQMPLTLETHFSDSWQATRAPIIDPNTGKAVSKTSHITPDMERSAEETVKIRRR
jgi:hypothetical protein